MKTYVYQYQVDVLKRIKAKGGSDPKQAPNSLDYANPPNMNILANPVKNSASVMKSNTAVGGRGKPVEKEAKKPTNADAEVKSALVVKPGVSVGMTLPSAKPDQLQKKETLEKEAMIKKEEAYNNKMKKIDDINAAKNNLNNNEKGENKENIPVDPEKKNKLMNQKKIEELQKKLFDVQIRLKNTGRKVN